MELNARGNRISDVAVCGWHRFFQMGTALVVDERRWLLSMRASDMQVQLASMNALRKIKNTLANAPRSSQHKTSSAPRNSWPARMLALVTVVNNSQHQLVSAVNALTAPRRNPCI
jgi:hypothetical protein